VAHLDDEERALVLGVLLEEVLSWVRGGQLLPYRKHPPKRSSRADLPFLPSQRLRPFTSA
jgi:hypothetical protein